MIRIVVALAMVMMASCSIKDLDLTGKQCPCPTGWVCRTDNTCERAASPTDDAAGEGEQRDAPADTSQITSCLTAPFTDLRYSTNFADFKTGWMATGGNYDLVGTQLQQQDKGAELAFAVHSTMIVQQNYRVVSTMRQIAGAAGGAVEIAFRINNPSKSMYHCNFEPNDGNFMIQHTDNGVAGSTLTLIQVDTSMVDTHGNITMEVQANGSSFECCLDNMVGAHITATSSLYPNGQPGVKTYLMAAAYRDFAVYQ